MYKNPDKCTICTKKYYGTLREIIRGKDIHIKWIKKTAENGLMHGSIHIIHEKSRKNGGYNRKKASICSVTILQKNKKGKISVDFTTVKKK